jgi:tetratricopeptide (TPR) repeat protein
LQVKRYTEAGVSYQKVFKLASQLEHLDKKVCDELKASTYHQLGYIAQEERQWKQAEQYYHQALQIMIKYNNRQDRARTNHQLGLLAQKQQQWQQAERYYQQALQIKIEYNDRYTQASTYGQLGILAQEQGQWQQAGEYLLQTLQIFVEYKDDYTAGIALRNLASLWKASNDVNVPARVSKVLGASIEETEKLLREILGKQVEKKTGGRKKK